MIYFDEDLRIFSSTEDREFGVVSDLTGFRGRRMMRRLGRDVRIGLNDKRRHDLEMAKITGKSPDQLKHEHQLAMKGSYADRAANKLALKGSYADKAAHESDLKRMKYADKADYRDYRVTQKGTEGYMDRTNERNVRNAENDRQARIERMRVRRANQVQLADIDARDNHDRRVNRPIANLVRESKH